MNRPINWSNPINQNHPLNKGLLAWWLVVPQWNGGTVWRDLTGHSNGTLTSMAPSSDWVTPSDRRGGWGALDFEGTNDHVDTNHIFNEVSDADKLTISTWINNPLTSNDSIFGGRGTGNAGLNFVSSGGVGGDPLRLTISGGFDQNSDASGMTANTWHHIAVTYDQVNVIFYIDGKQLSSHAQTAVISESDETMHIASFNNLGTPGTFFNGILDDIRVYTRALSGAEVAEYHSLSKRFYPGLLNRRSGLRGLSIAAAVAGVSGIIAPAFSIIEEDM